MIRFIYVGKINNRYYGFLFKDRGILRKAKLIYIKKLMNNSILAFNIIILTMRNNCKKVA